jgi:outer membrane protein OmpA-like peptidoglycan-associated protein
MVMSRSPRTKLCWVLLSGAALVTALTASARAQTREVKEEGKAEAPQKEELPEYRFSFGMFGGGHFFTKDHVLGRADGDTTDISPKSAPMFGALFGLSFNKWIGVEAEFGAIPSKTRNDSGNPDLDTKILVFAYRGSFVLNLSDFIHFQPFILAGYGAMTSLPNNSNVVESSTISFVHTGGGFKFGLTPWMGLRVDGRVVLPWTALSPVIPKGNRIGYTGPDLEVFGGLYVNFGEIEKVHFYKEVVLDTRTDKDNDGIPDDVDRCPTEPEDKDKFQDADGCPDPDNDADGIPDALDKCPNDPEDKDGFEDQDGCPDLDNDQDGVPDALDKCPNEPEDKDGFQDADGCPDNDNDNDGIADTIDKCPDQPETVNKYKDEDGCPDEVPAEVKKFTGVIQGINFKTGSAEILPGSWAILDRAVKVLQDYPDVNLEISGHTDSKGKASYNLSLSQHRADSVKLYMVSRGISANRLISIGYGKERPIADNSTASGRATNRRTEFRLINPGDK